MAIKEEKEAYERLDGIKMQIEALVKEADSLLQENDTCESIRARKHWIPKIRAQLDDDDEKWTMRDSIWDMERKWINAHESKENKGGIRQNE